MIDVKISHEIPDIYYKLHDRFGVEWDEGIIIANGGTIHCKNYPEAQKIVHETVHFQQQEKVGLEVWWNLYLTSDSFRLEQEVEAYRKEYAFIKKNIKNREHAYGKKREMAQHLSSSIYGNLLDYGQALKLIG